MKAVPLEHFCYTHFSKNIFPKKVLHQLSHYDEICTLEKKDRKILEKQWKCKYPIEHLSTKVKRLRR